jgi:hypothetical protein
MGLMAMVGAMAVKPRSARPASAAPISKHTATMVVRPKRIGRAGAAGCGAVVEDVVADVAACTGTLSNCGSLGLFLSSKRDARTDRQEVRESCDFGLTGGQDACIWCHVIDDRPLGEADADRQRSDAGAVTAIRAARTPSPTWATPISADARGVFHKNAKQRRQPNGISRCHAQRFREDFRRV